MILQTIKPLHRSLFIHNSKENQREEWAELPCQNLASGKLSMHQRTFEWRCLKMPHVTKQVYAMKISSFEDIELKTITTPPVQRICESKSHLALIVSWWYRAQLLFQTSEHFAELPAYVHATFCGLDWSHQNDGTRGTVSCDGEGEIVTPRASTR